MKVHTIKLREVHKPASNGGASFCSVLWDQQAHHLITASSSDSAISIHDPLLPSQAPKVLRHHRDGVTALAISPNSTCLASGSVDHSVKLYKFPSGEFETNITRFTLPIRTLAFNKSGTMLAAAGDDEGIKLINTIDGTIARVLKAHKGSVTGLAFDPNGEYLASMDSTGTVIYWELHSGTTLHVLRSIAPNTGSDCSIMNVLSWSPDGEMLAVPGLRNDVVMYDRDTAEKLFSLRGDHLQPVCFLSWSPNGKYMATSSLDKQVLIWDVEKKLDIDRQKFSERVSSMAWKPIGNALAIIDTVGKYGIWESVIPSSMKLPTEGILSSHSKNNNGLIFFEEEEEVGLSGSLSDLGEDSFGESGPPTKKRSRKQFAVEEFLEEDDALKEISLPPKSKSLKATHSVLNEGHDTVKEIARRTTLSDRPKMQVAFQSGSTPTQPGKRRFLCYNMIGSITTIEHEGYSHIEIDFHDTGRGPRIPSMTDHFGFTMASLNENGSVLANPCKGEKSLSTLMYRPFYTWANNSEWSMRFEGEEVKAVALGSGWVAAVTSLNFIRIFTEGGLQRYVISLDGPVVTASGFGDQLAIVNHASDCLPSDDQVLEFRVFNISNSTQPLKGRLPLSPGSQLTWFGFSEEGVLSFYDSKGVLRGFTSQFGGSWIPLFSPSKANKLDESYWVVGMNSSNIFCVICKKPDIFPQVMPKPILSIINFSCPLASSDLGAETLENEFMLNAIRLSQIQDQMEDLSRTGLDASSLDDDAFTIEAAQDKCILRLIASCCNSDKLVRATELVKLLSLDKSVRGAIKLVTALKLPNLAERFNTILEERLLEQKGEKDAILLNPKSNSCKEGNTLINKASAAPITSSASPQLSAPLFKKKASIDIAIVDKNCRDKMDTSKVKNIGEVMNIKLEVAEKVGNAAVEGNVKPQRPLNSFSRLKDEPEKEKSIVGEENKPKRPSNPFRKSTVK
ncbi:hypothetical protein SAY87_028389 [Trapa incisa]|uniref:WD repeat and HMG-box DNA-binding protein 1 n=1 Tax=Trapa incisa TaxID=236973 RepID=A0AAN7KUT2_9MYRT|nr:hypothetical protein SAY87_028389 [Trapa incisa]